MKALLLYLTLLLQGVPVQPNQTGTISGVLRNADGKPAANVRVAAVPQTEATEALTGGPTLSSIAETDEQGRYKLENVPPGRYYVTAGRLDLPTYYPGTQSMALGQVVGIVPGATVQGIDFAMNATSAGRSDSSFGAAFGNAPLITLLELQIDVRVEDGSPQLPVWSGGTPTALQLKPVLGGSVVSIPIDARQFNLAPPITDYKISVDGLPDGYQVKSVKFRGTELPDRILKMTLSTYVQLLLSNSTTPRPLSSNVLSVVLDGTAATARKSAGARVSGALPTNTTRSVYLSGLPGTVFSDGTFEFRGVLPGRHIILTADNGPSRPALAALVVVGAEDLRNVQLAATPVLPPNLRALTPLSTTETQSPGPVPLATVRGHILDSETGAAIRAGTIYLVGDSWATLEIGNEGKFEFPRLLPGSYEIEVQGVGYPTIRRAIVVEDRDIDLDLKLG